MASAGSVDIAQDPPYRVNRYRQPVRLIIAAEADGPVYHFATPSAEMLVETHHDIHDDVVAGVISDSLRRRHRCHRLHRAQVANPRPRPAHQ